MINSYKNGITAVAGGGQSAVANIGAVSGQGDAVNNRVTVVATTGDSVTLPQASPGLEYRIFNQGANSLNVFPFLGDSINALSANTAIALATTIPAIFVCMVAGVWNTIPKVPS